MYFSLPLLASLNNSQTHVPEWSSDGFYELTILEILEKTRYCR